MDVVLWLVLGLAAGVLALLAMYRTIPRDLVGWLGALVVGVAGGLFGGWLANLIGLRAANWLGRSSSPSPAPRSSSGCCGAPPVARPDGSDRGLAPDGEADTKDTRVGEPLSAVFLTPVGPRFPGKPRRRVRRPTIATGPRRAVHVRRGVTVATGSSGGCEATGATGVRVQLL